MDEQKLKDTFLKLHEVTGDDYTLEIWYGEGFLEPPGWLTSVHVNGTPRYTITKRVDSLDTAIQGAIDYCEKVISTHAN